MAFQGRVVLLDPSERWGRRLSYNGFRSASAARLSGAQIHSSALLETASDGFSGALFALAIAVKLVCALDAPGYR
jgi:hypothetical protein